MIFRQTYLKKFQIYTCALIISVILPLTKINVQTIYLLLWIYFYVNYIYLQIHYYYYYYIHVAADWADIFDTHQTRENVSQTRTPLHTVSRKHVVQPENRSKMLGTGVNLNVALVFEPVTWLKTINRGRKITPSSWMENVQIILNTESTLCSSLLFATCLYVLKLY